MKRFLILGFVAIIAMASCTKEIAQVPDGYGAKEFVRPTTPYVPDMSFKKVAYFPAYRSIANIDTTALDDLTHIIFSFLKPRADGVLVLDDSKESIKNIVSLAKRHKCKIMIALNGDNSIYTTLLSNPQTKQLLIKNIVAYTLENEFDGVDLDWEYPNASKGNDVTFGVFMKELSAELHGWHKSLSMAVTAGVYDGAIRDGINQNAIDACDFVNLMAYDGPNVIKPNVKNPNDVVDNPKDHSSYTFADSVLTVWLIKKNLPKEKAVLGLPAYGKTEDNKTAMSFRDLLNNGADKSGSEFTVAGLKYYYNGFPTISTKINLVKAKANGIMFWELGQDAIGENSLIRAATAYLAKP